MVRNLCTFMRMFSRPHLSDAPSIPLAPDSDAGGGGSGSGAGGQAPSTALAPPAGAEIEAMRVKLASYEKADADRRASDEKRALDEKVAAQKAGDHDKVIAAQNAEIEAMRAKLAALEPEAQYGRDSRAQQKARIEAAKKELPEGDQQLLDSIVQTGNLHLADAMLARMRISVGKFTAPRPTPGGTPPPADAPDFDKLAMENPRGFHDAVKKYPAEWSAHKEKLRGPQTRQPTLQERTAMKADANKPAKAG